MKKEDQKKTKKDRPRKHKAADEDEDASAKKPTNQFKNVERATQTYNKCTKVISQCIWIVDSYKYKFHVKNTEMQTEPPLKLNFNGLLNQWTIYDR